MNCRKAHALRTYIDGMAFLVAETCPHDVPMGAPFFACCAEFAVNEDGGAQRKGFGHIFCEFTGMDDVSKQPDGSSRVLCRFGETGAARPVQFGNPTIRHAEPGEGDGSSDLD